MAGNSIFDGVDRSDPCRLLEVLEGVLDRFLAGEMVVSARYGDDERKWQATDAPAIRARVNELRRQCAAKKSGQRISTVYITSTKGT